MNLKRRDITACLSAVLFLFFLTAEFPLFADHDEESEKALPEEWQSSMVPEPVFGTEICIVEAGNKNNDTVVLIHGLGDDGLLDWKNLIPILEKEYHVIALDLPGFGRSQTPEDQILSPKNYAKIIKWLVERNGKKQVFIVGHSFGGAVAIRFTAENPQYVKKLILADPAGILEKTAFLKHLVQKPNNSEDSAGNRFFKAQYNRVLGELIEKTNKNESITKEEKIVLSSVFTNKTTVAVALELISEDFSQAIAGLQVSTTVIWGELDKVAPLRTGRVLEYEIPDSELFVIKGGDHATMLSKPEEFNKIVLNSLKTPGIKPTRSPGSGTASNAKKSDKDSLKDLVCIDEWNKTYSGKYDTVVIMNCVNFKLENITANRVTIRDSDGEITNIVINSPETALSITDSAVTITVGDITGKTALFSDNTRLDLAGVSFSGENSAITVQKDSLIIFSICKLSGPVYKGNIHGTYKGKEANIEVIMLKTINETTN